MANMRTRYRIIQSIAALSVIPVQKTPMQDRWTAQKSVLLVLIVSTIDGFADVLLDMLPPSLFVSE
jgi:hypothetical protein